VPLLAKLNYVFLRLLCLINTKLQIIYSRCGRNDTHISSSTLPTRAAFSKNSFAQNKLPLSLYIHYLTP